MGEGLDSLYHLVGDDDAAVKGLAAVGDAVAYGSNLVIALDDTHLGVDQSFQHNLDARRVVGDGKLLVVLFTMILVGEFTHFQTDALQQALGHHLGVVGHVHQLILD